MKCKKRMPMSQQHMGRTPKHAVSFIRLCHDEDHDNDSKKKYNLHSSFMHSCIFNLTFLFPFWGSGNILLSNLQCRYPRKMMLCDIWGVVFPPKWQNIASGTCTRVIVEDWESDSSSMCLENFSFFERQENLIPVMTSTMFQPHKQQWILFPSFRNQQQNTLPPTCLNSFTIPLWPKWLYLFHSAIISGCTKGASGMLSKTDISVGVAANLRFFFSGCFCCFYHQPRLQQSQEITDPNEMLMWRYCVLGGRVEVMISRFGWIGWMGKRNNELMTKNQSMTKKWINQRPKWMDGWMDEWINDSIND